MNLFVRVKSLPVELPRTHICAHTHIKNVQVYMLNFFTAMQMFDAVQHHLVLSPLNKGGVSIQNIDDKYAEASVVRTNCVTLWCKLCQNCLHLYMVIVNQVRGITGETFELREVLYRYI